MTRPLIPARAWYDAIGRHAVVNLAVGGADRSYADGSPEGWVLMTLMAPTGSIEIRLPPNDALELATKLIDRAGDA